MEREPHDSLEAAGPRVPQPTTGTTSADQSPTAHEMAGSMGSAQEREARTEKMQSPCPRIRACVEAADGGGECLVGEEKCQGLLPSRRQRAQIGRDRRAVHEEPQARDETGKDDDGDRRPDREQLGRDDLRSAGKDDGAHAERTPDGRARGRRADAADKSKGDEPDARGKHLGEAGPKIVRSEESAHAKKGRTRILPPGVILARRVRRLGLRSLQPFTPPEVKPPTTRSWKMAIRMQIGTMAMISAAEMSGHGNANSPW